MHARVCPNRTACEELIREVAPLDHELYAHARRWLRGTIAAALTLTLTLTLTLSLTLTLTLIVTLTLTLTITLTLTRHHRGRGPRLLRTAERDAQGEQESLRRMHCV